MGKMQLKVADLNKMSAFDILDNPDIKERFVGKYNQIHNSEDGEMFYESEKYNFQKLLSTTKGLKECTGFSVYGVFMDIAAMGLSIAPQSKPLLYVLTRNANVGSYQQPVWEKRAHIDVSPYGELALRVQAGQIAHADRPVVVYEKDTFKPGLNEYGNKYVKYEAQVPRTSNVITGSFIGLTRPDGTKDFYWMMEGEIERLKKASNKQNKGNQKEDKSNALYSSNDGQIDIGFLEAKTLKHSLMTFPKIRIGQFTKLQQFDDEPKPADYGLGEEDQSELNKAKPEVEPFGADDQPEETHEAETVQVQDENEIF